MQIKNKILVILFITILTLTTVLFVVQPEVDAYMKFVINPNSISFCGTSSSFRNYYGKNDMYVEAKATSSDGVNREYIIVVYVESTNITYKFRSYTDGYNKTTGAIPIKGGSNVTVSAYCSDSSVQVNLALYMYSV